MPSSFIQPLSANNSAFTMWPVSLHLSIDIIKLIDKCPVCSVCVYGGGNRREQVSLVAEGIEIIIATPGRLNDLVMAGEFSLKNNL